MAQPRRQKVSLRDPYSTKYSDNVGDRIPHGGKVDKDDPARTDILLTINQMAEAGVLLDERAVEIATQLGRWHHELALLRDPVVPGDVPRWKRRGVETDAHRPTWVYYLRCGSLIKIGTTMDLPGRLIAIRPNEVLAVEPGGHIIEAERHREFAELRASGEYFHPGPALQQQVLSVREAYGPPTITSSIVPDGNDWFPRAA